MNLPTSHQVAVAGTHIATAAAATIATLGFIHIFSPQQVTDATQAIGQISDGIGKIMAGMGTLIALASGLYATITSGPFASLFRSAQTIAADPAKLAQLQATPFAQQAPLVTVTDKLPDVAGVGTTSTPSGKALSMSIPSTTVQSVSPKVA